MGRLSDTDITRIADLVRPKPEPEPASWLERATRRRVMVHTDADSIEGTLAAVAADGVLLCAAKLITDTAPVDLAGEVFVPRERVLFVQTLRM